MAYNALVFTGKGISTLTPRFPAPFPTSRFTSFASFQPTCGHQVVSFNFCKNPACSNYGVEPPDTPKHAKVDSNPYRLHATGKGLPAIKCNACGEIPPLKSNLGIAEEFDRLASYLTPCNDFSNICCPNTECENHTVPLSQPKAYRSFGKAASGAKRVQCSKCKKTFTASAPATKGQHHTDNNVEIFKLLVNKVPLSRIINILGISWAVLYKRIDYIHRQCLALARHYESKFATFPFEKLYLATDRQEYEVNWTEREDKRNIVLSAIATADNTSGYIFGIHPNFDPTLNKEAVEADAKAINDTALASPYRKYARLWLDADYIKTSQRKRNGKLPASSLIQAIADKYQEAVTRDDVEVSDEKTKEEKLPDYGMQVHEDYTMIAHYYFLKKLLPTVGKWRFFTEQESGIRSAVLSVFRDEVKAHTAEVFYVRIEKELTVDDKRKLKSDAKKWFDYIKQNSSGLDDNQVKLA